MAITIEQLAAEIVTLRNEMNAMQTSVILTQGLIRTGGRDVRDEEREEKDKEKNISFKIKEAQHLIPAQWCGEKDGPFQDLAHDVITYMTSIFDEEAIEMLDEVIKGDKAPDMNDLDDDDYPNKKIMNSHLYALLSKITKGEPKTAVRNAARNGIAAWHRLHANYDPRTTTDSSVSIQKIMNPVKGKDAASTKAALEKFETDIREHEAKFETVPDSLKVAGIKNLIPEAWFEQHFKGTIYKDYAEAKARVLNIANDRRAPRMKANGGNEATVNYWGEEDQEEEGLNYYGAGQYTPYGKSNYKSYGKGGGKYDYQQKGGKNGFGFGGKAKGKGKGKDGYKGLAIR